MNKEKAAEFLGVSIRTLQRYTAAGKVPARSVHTPHGHQAEYEREDLERLKAELTAAVPRYVRPTVTPDAGVTPGAATTTALAPIQPNFAEKLTAALEALKEAWKPAAPAVPLSEKLMLTLAEAAALSGLSKGYLRNAITDKQLKAQVIGKGWKVKRADLDKFIQKL